MDNIIEDDRLDYTSGISDDELTERFNAAIKIKNQMKTIKGVPISKFDFKNNKPYLEYPDGRIEYLNV